MRGGLRTAGIGAGMVVLIVLLIGLWLRADGEQPTALDLWWHDLVGLSAQSPVLPIAVGLHLVGSTLGIVLCIVLAVVLLAIRRRWRDAGSLVLAGILGVVGSETLKLIAQRPRPLDSLVVEQSFSYPSGHSMGAAMLAVSLALIFESERTRAGSSARSWIWAAACLWTIAMMWSRAAVRVHWLTDTLAGASLGVAVAILARLIVMPRRG